MDEPIALHPSKTTRRNRARRSLGLLIAGLPFALLALSAASAPGYAAWSRGVGLGFMGAALVVAALNLHVSFVRPWLYQRAHGSVDGYKNISHGPLIGLLLVLIGCSFGRGSSLCAALGAAAVLLDTASPHWFVAFTWQDASFWDD